MNHAAHHHHHHHDMSDMTEKSLWWAVGANILLTFAQIIGGVISGSLSLIADALHNFSDAASLIIALIAIRIGRRPADDLKTFGYKRAETIAALISLTSLIIIGLYLIFEALKRFYAPVPIEGSLVIIVAGFALLIDTYTAFLTYRASKTSMNIKAAFIHNLTDAFASVGVIISGLCIIYFNWLWVDAAITLIIAGYILWQGFLQMPKVINLLMDSTPETIDVTKVITAMEKVSGVQNAHHLHVRNLDEHRIALEAHIVIKADADIDALKVALKQMLKAEFNILHSTLEFEVTRCC